MERVERLLVGRIGVLNGRIEWIEWYGVDARVRLGIALVGVCGKAFDPTSFGNRGLAFIICIAFILPRVIVAMCCLSCPTCLSREVMGDGEEDRDKC